MEMRLHGRGGQGGVTCAKILAAIYARMGKSVQAFGDYAGERSGAPIRAYTRVSDGEITNRNKVYKPDHLLVLDPSLLTDEVIAGLAPGGTLLINSEQPVSSYAERFGGFRVAAVDATAIARRHGIGTRTVVIVNTTITGALARLFELPLDAIEKTYDDLGFSANFEAAKEAYGAVQVHEASAPTAGSDAIAEGGSPWGKTVARPVRDLLDHTEGPAPTLKTGAWRSQAPEYTTKLAPCNALCPAGNDVVGFIQATADGDEASAAAILARSNPLPGVCGRVCPAFCMDRCNRRDHDGAVNVRGIERWVADQAGPAKPEIAVAANPRRIAIVGGGPAGLAAAYTLACLGHQPTIFDAEASLGGVLRTGIPSYRLPREVLDREVEAIAALGVETRLGERLDAAAIDALTEQYDGVVLATGLQRLRTLDVPGVDLTGVRQGIAFLHDINLKGDVELRGHVVVLGGGNTAMDCARSALRAGAQKVTVAYRRSRHEMPAIADEVEEAEEEGVVFVFQRAPVGLRGEGQVDAVELAEVELGEPDDSGRRRPVLTDRLSTLACDTVLLALGQSADTGLLPAGWQIDERRVWKDGKPLDVFAAGDLFSSDGTVTHAIGDGRRAAAMVLRAHDEQVEVFSRPDVGGAVNPAEVRPGYFVHRKPAVQLEEPAAQRVGHFKEVGHGLPDGAEALRCFSCGHCNRCDTCLVYCPEGIVYRDPAGGYLINYDYCKGCGICVTECPRSAMTMVSA